MDVKHNFLSVVTLGVFNPAILTADFLKNQEIWSTPINPEGKTTPVVSELKYGNISFFVELERFQVMHRGIEDFKTSPIVDAAYKYIEILQYTPLYALGINFNVSLTNFQEPSGIKTVFEDPITEISKYVEKADEYRVDIKTSIKSGIKETLSISCKYYRGDSISTTINLSRRNEKLILNFNREIEKLDSDRSRIRLIFDNFPSVFDEFERFLNKIKE